MRISFDDIVSILEDAVQKDLDYHVLVCGNNGSGKSALAITLANMLSYRLKYGVRMIALQEEFLEAIGGEKQILVLDEGESILGIRDSQLVVGNIINMIKINRFKQNLMIVNAISPSKVFKEYREEKIKMIIHVFYRDETKSVASVFFSDPLLTTHTFHQELEEILDSSYSSLEEYGYIVENSHFFKGYLVLRREDVVGYEEYRKWKEEMANRINSLIKEKLTKRKK
ncbi:MAG: ATP-binding protein [Thermoplasmata archaeon]